MGEIKRIRHKQKHSLKDTRFKRHNDEEESRERTEYNAGAGPDKTPTGRCQELREEAEQKATPKLQVKI